MLEDPSSLFELRRGTQKTDVRCQMSEDRSQRPDDWLPNSKVRWQKAVIRYLLSVIRNPWPLTNFLHSVFRSQRCLWPRAFCLIKEKILMNF